MPGRITSYNVCYTKLLRDGIEATQRIRNGEAGKEKREIPVIGVTAHALAEIKNKCINVGMNVCVTKPVDFKSLLEIIESFSPTGTPAAAQPRTSAPLRSGSSTGILNKSDVITSYSIHYTKLYECPRWPCPYRHCHRKRCR